MSALIYLVVLIAFLHTNVEGLRCWHCSSDVDSRCMDTFNLTDIQRGGRGGVYDNFQQNYNNQQNQRNYDGNFNNNNNQQRNYDQRNYNQGFNNQLTQGPQMQNCNEDDARIRRMKNVCIKKVTSTTQGSGRNRIYVVRRCEQVPFDTVSGTNCYDPVSRGMNLDYCQYCDYDGCNDSTRCNLNHFLAAFLFFSSLFHLLKH